MTLVALVFTLASFHPLSEHANPINPGIGLNLRFVQTGLYVNSQRMMSTYVTTEKEWRRSRAIGLGVGAGVVTGYRQMAVLPMAYLFVRIGPARLLILPTNEPVIGLQWTLRR